MAKKEQRKTPEIKFMPKPKYKIGEIVSVTFLGTIYQCEILDLQISGRHDEKWIYKAKSLDEGIIIPFIGINGSEQFANIYDEIK